MNPHPDRPAPAPVSRRSFLRGAGVLAALPFLESLAPTVLRAGLRVPVKPPVRFGIYTVTGGTVSESWVPQAEGKLGKLPSILRSLEAQKNELLILSNLAQSGGSDGKLNAHEHCAYLHLTAADKVGKLDSTDIAGVAVAKLEQQATEECTREGKNTHDLPTPPREIKLRQRGLEFKSVAMSFSTGYY